MANNLSYKIKTTRVSNAAAAGTSAVNSSSVDMANFEGVRFEVAFGAIVSGAATSIKLQQSSDDSNWNDLEGTSQTVADTDDNKVFIAEVYAPADRYVRCVVSRATQNSTVDSIVALQYGARGEQPLTNDSSTVGGQEVHASPAEGTA